jgi:hypothetical protein
MLNRSVSVFFGPMSELVMGVLTKGVDRWWRYCTTLGEGKIDYEQNRNPMDDYGRSHHRISSLQ